MNAMSLPDIFTTSTTEAVIARINQLDSSSQPLWGTMSAAKMLAHCNVTYEMVFENIHPKPNFFLKWILKTFVKQAVVGETPYKQNSRTGPAFIIKSEKDFVAEKDRLTGYLQKTLALGKEAFHKKESLSFGPLSSTEWNNMFYKHLDHHLRQFGV